MNKDNCDTVSSCSLFKEKLHQVTLGIHSFPTRPLLQTIDLNAFLIEHEKYLRSFIGSSVNLLYLLAPDIPPIQAIPDQLKELIGIFLSNANKTMPRGGQLLLQTTEVVLSSEEEMSL